MAKRKKPVDKLTDEELAAQIAEIQLEQAAKLALLKEELEKRELIKAEAAAEAAAAKEVRAAALRIHFLELVKNDPDLLDFLVGEHTEGRYGETCNDENLARGTTFAVHGGKNKRCMRCLLLEAVSIPEYCDSAIAEIELVFEAHYLQY